MPSSTYFGTALAQALNNSEVPMSRLDDMVTRILTSLYSVGIMGSITPTGKMPNTIKLC